MANVLKDEKKQQIIALGRLGWSLRKIQEATRVRRETISAHLRGAGVEIWPPGRWRRESKAKAAIEVITGSDAAKPAIPGGCQSPQPQPQTQPRKPFSEGKSNRNFKTGHSGDHRLWRGVERQGDRKLERRGLGRTLTTIQWAKDAIILLSGAAVPWARHRAFCLAIPSSKPCLHPENATKSFVS